MKRVRQLIEALRDLVQIISEADEPPSEGEWANVKDAIGKALAEVPEDETTEPEPVAELVSEVIRHEGDKWVLYSKDGSRKLGTFDTEEEAEERERQIQFFKRQREAEADAMISQACDALGALDGLEEAKDAKGNVATLVATFDAWAGGSVNKCVEVLSAKPGIAEAGALCGWIKDQAHGPGWRSEKRGTREAASDADPEPSSEAEPGAGTGGQCVCPECGAAVAHEAGTPCATVDCPECGAKMQREATEEPAETDAEPEPEPVAEVLAESAAGGIIEISEADSPRGPLRMKIAIIRPGFGNAKDGHYYTRELLERHKDLFKGVKMFETDHEDAEKSTRNWPSTITSAYLNDDGTLMGDVVVHDPNFAERAVNLKRAGLLHLLPNSIYASGTSKEGEVEGQKAKIVETIDKVHSVDWVTAAGAGGHALDLVEGSEGASDASEVIEEVTVQDLPAERVEELLSEAGVADPYHGVLARRRYGSEDEVRAAAADMKAALKEVGAGTVHSMGGRSRSAPDPTDRAAAEAAILKRYGIGG